jgi:sporulation protein YlmC with PRC-barrel domain
MARTARRSPGTAIVLIAAILALSTAAVGAERTGPAGDGAERDNKGFAAAIAAVDEDRRGGDLLVPETKRPFLGAKALTAEGASLQQDERLAAIARQEAIRRAGGGGGAVTLAQSVLARAASRGRDSIVRLQASERGRRADGGTQGQSTDQAGATQEADAAPGSISVADLLGRTVRDEQGRTVGTVEDILLSPATRGAQRIVIAVAGDLRDRFDATATVPASAVSLDGEDGPVTVERSALPARDSSA